jgi:arabinofuranan 3-O-arabinosyltransferase
MTAAVGQALADPPGPLHGGQASGGRPVRSATMPAEPAEVRTGRWLLAVWLLALIMFLATDSGRMIFDTKLGVDIDPAGFLARLWPLWNPREWFGTLQDQYIGYAIPMAPFFLAAHLLLPVWIVERLWLSVLVAVAFWGMVKLATALRVGSPRARILAGVVFALWPTFTIIIGSTSAGVLPGILAPWAVLPLVPAVRRDGGHCAAAARSGVAVLLMGGVNATSTLCALVLPGVFILVQSRGRRRLRLALWWCAAVFAATAWWTIPLLLQGRYSFNFLPYVEQAATTTKTVSAASFLRGAGNWTAYFNLGTPWLSAGWALVSSPAAVLASAAAVAAGLAGLARRDMPYRRWLLICTALAALGALAGYAGPLGGALHIQAQTLLNGPLAPFRNVYKLEPVAAAALALGCAHVTARGWRRAALQRRGAPRIAAGTSILAVTLLVLAGLALPMLTGQVLQPGSFPRVPRYWSAAAAFLAARSATQTALVVPTEPHGTYLWGDPIDDPLEPLASSPWAERSLVPYGGPGSQSFLDTAENAIESGQRVPGLAAYLQRAGIRYLVVRNDLNPSMLGYASPQIVHATLRLSGFSLAASFGPRISARTTAVGVPADMRPYLASYPAVQIYQAADPGLRPAGPADALPTDQTVLVNGGPDALLQLSGQGVRAAQPAVIAGNPLPVRPAEWAVTDGLRRADNAFGLTSANLSYTYTATEDNPPDDQLGGAGGPPRQLLPVTAAGHQTVAVLSGAAAVTASSFGSWLTEDPQADPVNAFDGNPATAWTEGSASTPDGQWIQITFSHPVRLPASIGVRLLADIPSRSVANELQVSTAAGAVTTTVLPRDGRQRLGVKPGLTSSLRITIVSASNVVPGAPGAGIRDVLIPGVRVTRYLKVPQDQAGQQAAGVLYSFSQQNAPQPGVTGEITGVPAGPPSSSSIARIFSTSTTQPFRLSGTVTAVPGAALNTLLARLTPHRRSGLQVTASSTLGSQAEFGPANLFRTSPARPWISSGSDPTLQLRWPGRRRISSMLIEPAFGFSAAPDQVHISSPDGSRSTTVGLDGNVSLVPPLVTRQMTISFPGGLAASPSVTPGQPAGELFGLGSISIPALRGLRVAAPPLSGRFHLACGRGPVVTIDEVRYPTAVSGTMSALVRLRPVHLRVCLAGGVDLALGQHMLSAPGSSLFAMNQLSLRASTTTDTAVPGTASTDITSGTAAAPAADAGAAATAQRAVHALSWQPDSRRLSIGPGAQSYLEVHQNASAGWVATLDGKRLQPVTLDGWQQGYLVPAGQGGVVSMTFSPARVYHLGLAVSALLVVVLLVLAGGLGRLVPARLRSRPRWPHRRRPGESGPRATGRLVRLFGLGSGRRPAGPADAPTGWPAQGAERAGDHAVAADAGYQADRGSPAGQRKHSGPWPGSAERSARREPAADAGPRADGIWPAERPWPAGSEHIGAPGRPADAATSAGPTAPASQPSPANEPPPASETSAGGEASDASHPSAASHGPLSPAAGDQTARGGALPAKIAVSPGTSLAVPAPAAPPGAKSRHARLAAAVLSLLALCVLIFLVGGPVVIAVPILALIGYRWPRLLPPVSVVAILCAGIVAATAASPASPGTGAFSAAAQACALVALAAALMPAVTPGSRRS